MSQTLSNLNYSFNSAINSSVFGIPLLTIGLIGVTSSVLAYITLAETDTSSTPIPTASSMPSSTPSTLTGGKKSRKSQAKTKKSKK